MLVSGCQAGDPISWLFLAYERIMWLILAKKNESRSVSFPNQLARYQVRLLCLWDFPSKNTGACCNFLLQGVFPTQESNSHLQHYKQIFFFFFFFFTTEPLGKPQCQMLRTVPGICYMCYLCDLDETVIIVVTLVEVVSSVKINLHYPTICHIKLN